MKTVYILIVFLLAIPLWAQEVTFRTERLITDYRGIAFNGSAVLCYGDYGIITRSTDFGATWSQISLGDKHSIKRIFATGNEFIGVTDYSLIFSQKNGAFWDIVDVSTTPDIIDITIYGDSTYILTKSNVLSVKNDQTIKQFLTLDSNLNYGEIHIDETGTWITCNDTLLIRYNASKLSFDTVYVAAHIPPANKAYPNIIHGLRNNEGTLTFTVSNDYTTYSYDKILQTFNKGETWETFFPGAVYNGSCSHIVNNERYYIRPKSQYIPDEANDLLAIDYIKADTSHYSADTSYITVINPLDSAKLQLSMSRYSFYFQEILALTPDTIIAVGKDKCIAMSYDSGKTWNFLSCIKYSNASPSNFICRNANTMFLFNTFSFFRTTDGGATWLPQTYTHTFKGNKSANPRNYFLTDKEKGYIVFDTNIVPDANVFATSDNGYTYKSYGYDSLMLGGSLYKNGIKTGERYAIFTRKPSFTPLNLLLLYNENLQLLDSVRLPFDNAISMTTMPDESILTLGLRTAGKPTADSDGYAPDYSYSYALLRSTDYGKTWDSITLPITQPLRYAIATDKYYYDNPVLPELKIVGQNIIIPTNNHLLYRYDYLTRKFDSVYIDAPIKTSFILNNRLCFITEENTLYSAENIKDSDTKWDSIKAENIFSKWNNEDQSTIFNVQSTADTTAIMLISKQVYAVPKPIDYLTNIVKISVLQSPVGVQHNAVEHPAWLWKSEPYPMPAHGFIRCDVSCEPKYNISDATINIRSISGSDVPNVDQTTRIIQQSRNGGYIEWNCEDIPKGLYIITIRLAEQHLNIPVLVF
ncbi:hypothetical protein MASR2M18_13090 [Ignavibacteria bacterium]|nr:hypothetical protein [Bacteroidota bacterium]MCZ2132401.1 hypothetical protein [Bacteroidota bacterium]